MTDIKENECDNTTKRKKRQKALEKEDEVSRVRYEEDFAEGYLNKLFRELDEAMFTEVLSSIVKIEDDISNIEEHYQRMESLLKDREDLKWALLGFLKPYQAVKCGKLMSYCEMHAMKQFVRNLMSNFKRQPHSLQKVVDKLSELAESEDLKESLIEEEIAPLLQKNCLLVEQLLKLLPAEKPPDWFYSSEDTWEDFSLGSNLHEEEILDVPHCNELVNTVPKNCLYVCKNKKPTSLCPICSVKFINGRLYIASGRMLRSANLVFKPNEEVENTIRLTGKADFFTPSVRRPRVHKRHKESVDGISSPLTLGTESEEELGENDVRPRKRRRKTAQRLKIRFDSVKEKQSDIKVENDTADNNHTDDTAASNDDGSCDDMGRDDNDNKFLLRDHVLAYGSMYDGTSTVCKGKEVVNLENTMELNISAMTGPYL